MDSFGIYKIECCTTGVVYIGSTSVSFKKRWRKHKQRLRHNYHENNYLQNAWNKYGEENFIFEIVEHIEDINIVKERESHWLSLYFSKGRDYCFNLSDHTDGGNTVKDEESRKKLSESVKKSYTPELREIRRKQAIDNNTIEQARNKVNTPEWKEAHLKGVKKLARDPEWIKKNNESKIHLKVKVGTNRGEIFESVAEASRQTGAFRSAIRACINGKIKSSMNRKWFYINN